MSGSFFAKSKRPAGGWRTMTLTEALLAVFTVGLLLGLWLGGVTGKREMREMNDLQRRVESLEHQQTLLEDPFFSSPSHPSRDISPETESGWVPASVPAIRV